MADSNCHRFPEMERSDLRAIKKAPDGATANFPVNTAK